MRDPVDGTNECARGSAADGAVLDWSDVIGGRGSGVVHARAPLLPGLLQQLDVACGSDERSHALAWCAALLLLERRCTGRECLGVNVAGGVLSLAADDAESASAWRLRCAAAWTPSTPADAALACWHDGPALAQPSGLGLFDLGRDGDQVWLCAADGAADDVAASGLLQALVTTLHDLLADDDALASDAGQAAASTLDGPPEEQRFVSVVDAFRAACDQWPAAPAVVQGAQTLDYHTLDTLSDAVAQRLRAAVDCEGRVVAVALERSAQTVVVLLGVLKAGAAYLPLDAALPPARLARMLRDSAACAVVAERRLPVECDCGLPLLSPTAEQSPVAQAASETPPGDATAYVLFTSGSTGEPKGIAIPHSAILRLVRAAHYLDLPAGERVLHAARLGFDVSTAEIWGPLLNGGCCVVHEEALPSAAGLGATIRRHRVTTVLTTAAVFNAIVDQDVRQLAGLRQLVIGGEALSVVHLRRAQAALPGLQLINGYGPTECTTITTAWRIPAPLPEDAVSVPIGAPITGTRCIVTGPDLRPLPPGLAGELCVAGSGLARGYVGRPDLTNERFVHAPDGLRLYRTGDRVRLRPDGTLDFLGRRDGQIKLRGLRIELAEVEAALASHPQVRAAGATVHTGAAGQRLVGYVVPAEGEAPAVDVLRHHLLAQLPPYMVPAAWVVLDSLPVTPNGKLDRRALPLPASQRPALAQPWRAPADEGEARWCRAFADLLGLDAVGADDNFFDLGGSSLLVMQLLARQSGEGMPVDVAGFFADPTPAGLAARGRPPEQPVHRPRATDAGEPIAIVAVGGRFPGADTVEAFWDLLCDGREGITRFSPGTLDRAVPAALRNDPAYVAARGVIEGVELFDAAFFGISPGEADTMDPQQRVFLELCWEVLERSGHAPGGEVGVFAGMHNATYFQRHLQPQRDLLERMGEVTMLLANEKDYVATRVAHRLDLTGPAVSVNTACSTSLVAIAQAVAALRAGQCSLALAGGVAITCPPRTGHLYEEGGMLSPDGSTRTFDAAAQGTVFSDGAAVVALRRLSDALADGDPVIALLRGVAVNNDGRRKASFTAPSVDGQAAVVGAALRAAGLSAADIDYVEAHGTATPLGDPVELAALTQAFARDGVAPGSCRIGSLKSNVGHLVTAAGAAGVIKAALALERERLPATLHYRSPNPHLRLESSPFVVQAEPADWPRTARPRRAGVSSFGVGGTNAHAVIEEAPLRAPSTAAAGPQQLLLSARTPAALLRNAEALAAWLDRHPDANLADVAHTLDVGRARFEHRLAVVADHAQQAAEALRSGDAPQRVTGHAGGPPLVWMFPGQGAQYAGMGLALAEADPHFRAAYESSLDAVSPWLEQDPRALLQAGDAQALAVTAVTQPLTFCLEYALGAAWLALGAEPVALVGHSVGEFAAAVHAGVMSLADAARLVARRGALMQAQATGAMLALRCAASEAADRVPQGLVLAADNAPGACVVAGPVDIAEAWLASDTAQSLGARRLRTSHAFHSPAMDPAVPLFEAEVRRVTLSAPQRPLVSTVTGRWMQPHEATDPGYWAGQLRAPVRFSPAVQCALARHPEAVFLEVGPRDGLSQLVRQQRSGPALPRAVASLGDAREQEPLQWQLAQASCWAVGTGLRLAPAHPPLGRHRLCLPTYSFDRRRHWIEAPAAADLTSGTDTDTGTDTDGRHSMGTTPTAIPARRERLLGQLRALFEDVAGADLSAVEPGTRFVEAGLDSLTLTQVAMQVKRSFGVAVTFRQLMESYRSFDALAAHLDATLPPEAAPPPTLVASPPAAPVAALPAAGTQVPATADAPLLQQLIVQQMQLMSQQLALLSGGAAAAVLPAAPAATATPVAPAESAPAPEEPAAPVRYDVKKAFGAIARIHTQAAEMSERQRVRLDAFVRHYTERTKASKAYTARHRPHLADPRVVNGFRPMTKEIVYQIVIERSQGSHLWDLDGNAYVDVLNGFGMNLFGWQPEFVQEAVRRQLDAGYEIGPQHPLAGEVAELVCELTGFDRAGLCNTGSEAVMAALRIARTVTGRSKVVLFSGSYHGTFDEVVVRAGRGGRGIPAAPGIMAGAFGDVQVLDYGTPEATSWIREHADDVAAVLVEAVQSRRPDFQPREFLHELRALTENAGICLIFDEVITGFRAHPRGAQGHFGLKADLATYGKVIGGGFPVGVVAGRREYMDALDGGAWQYGDDSIPTVGVTYFAGTFVRHPLALAAAKASLEHLKAHSPTLQNQLNLHTAAMADELSAYCREVGAPLTIRGFASLWRVTWLEDHPLQDLLFAMMRCRGVHILDNFPCFMTTAHTAADIATIKTAFKESVAEMQEAGFLPRATSAGVLADASRPPVPNARLGRDKEGRPTWFVPDPSAPGKFVKVAG